MAKIKIKGEVGGQNFLEIYRRIKVKKLPRRRSKLSKNREKSADVLMDTPITLFHGAEQV